MSGAADRLIANGKSITLESIGASGSSRLEVERNNGFTDLYMYDGKVHGSFNLQDSEMLVFSSGTAAEKSISGPIPETLNFKAAVKGGQPLHLRLKTSKDFHLDGLQISQMALQREDPPRSGSFVSAIFSGTVKLPVKQETPLEEHDWLRLKEASSTRLLLTFAGASKDSFDFHFQGTARSLSAGPEGFEQNLTPSLLLWFYHNQEIATFWGALGCVCSLLCWGCAVCWKRNNFAVAMCSNFGCARLMKHNIVSVSKNHRSSFPPMKRIALLGVLLAMFVSGCVEQKTESNSPYPEPLYELYKPLVVQIQTKFVKGKPEHGFGFIVGEDAAEKQFYIVTANHVVRNEEPDDSAAQISVRLSKDSGESRIAKLLDNYSGKKRA